MSQHNQPAVEQVAREYLAQHGADAVSVLIDRAELDEALGDTESAATWREIAAAVGRLLNTSSASRS